MVINIYTYRGIDLNPPANTIAEAEKRIMFPDTVVPSVPSKSAAEIRNYSDLDLKEYLSSLEREFKNWMQTVESGLHLKGVKGFKLFVLQVTGATEAFLEKNK